VGGLAGPLRVYAFVKFTHVVWGTGGGMVPEYDLAKYLAKGK
ncbi:D-serine ammonia-lyase, partial [Enterobacter hormaechei]